MEKEFVTYEQALALKELGFDEPCFFAFDNCSTPMRCSDLRTNEQKFNGVNYNSSTYTSQPTFSQAFRWFREKYNIDAWVQPFTSIKSNGKMFLPDESYSFFIFKDGIWVDDKTDFVGPEEAELACLRKLIEIVKNLKKDLAS